VLSTNYELAFSFMEIIFAASISALVQWLKQYMPNQWFTLGLPALLSLLAAAIWQSALEILTISVTRTHHDRARGLTSKITDACNRTANIDRV
jgi:hypothetical protein